MDGYCEKCQIERSPAATKVNHSDDDTQQKARLTDCLFATHKPCESHKHGNLHNWTN